jgi:hypothetical protein
MPNNTIWIPQSKLHPIILAKVRAPRDPGGATSRAKGVIDEACDLPTSAEAYESAPPQRPGPERSPTQRRIANGSPLLLLRLALVASPSAIAERQLPGKRPGSR